MRNVLERARDALRAGTRPIYQIDTGTWKVTHEELLAELERALKDLDGPAHAWIDFHGTVACGSCGVVKRGDGKNKPCRGRTVAIETREAARASLDLARSWEHLYLAAHRRSRSRGDAIDRIGSLLSEHGCDCECDHSIEDHDDGCERCLACRIGNVLVEERHANRGL